MLRLAPSLTFCLPWLSRTGNCWRTSSTFFPSIWPACIHSEASFSAPFCFLDVSAQASLAYWNFVQAALRCWILISNTCHPWKSLQKCYWLTEISWHRTESCYIIISTYHIISISFISHGIFKWGFKKGEAVALEFSGDALDLERINESLF